MDTPHISIANLTENGLKQRQGNFILDNYYIWTDSNNS